MRSDGFVRPRDERTLVERVDDAPAFALMEGWLARARRIEGLQNAGWVTNPLRSVARLFASMDRLSREEARIWGALFRRYEGVLKQMLASENASAAAVDRRLIDVFRKTRAAFLLETAHEHYPVVLWKAYCDDCPSPPGHLKPKLMLRAFVDEISSSDERGILKAVCYAVGASPAQSTTELRQGVARGCDMLHHQVMSYGHRIDAISGGALTQASLAALDGADAVRNQYGYWLFQSAGQSWVSQP